MKETVLKPISDIPVLPPSTSAELSAANQRKKDDIRLSMDSN